MAPIVGYWNFAGKGEAVRLVLAYLGVDFTDETYSKGPDGKGVEWFSVKSSLGFDFPNLPYYIDGDLKMTQTFAILRHLARVHNLYGSTEQDRIRIDMAEQELNDMLAAYVVYKFKKGPTNEAEVLDKLDIQLRGISNFLGNRKYVAGETISYVDFWVYVCLGFLLPNEKVEKILAKFSNLNQFSDRIAELPKIKAYLQKRDKKA